MAQETTVVNIKKCRDYDIYIGRGSDYGNPYKIGASMMGKPMNREQVVKLFEVYARKRIHEIPEFRANVKRLYGKRLGCFCMPEACHGNVLAKLAKEIHDEDSKAS